MLLSKDIQQVWQLDRLLLCKTTVSVRHLQTSTHFSAFPPSMKTLMEIISRSPFCRLLWVFWSRSNGILSKTVLVSRSLKSHVKPTEVIMIDTQTLLFIWWANNTLPKDVLSSKKNACSIKNVVSSDESFAVNVPWFERWLTSYKGEINS